MAEEGTITIRKDSLWKYSTFVLLALVIVMTVIYFRGDSGSGTPSGAVVGNTPQPAQVVVGERVNVETADAPVLGDKSADVTIVEFSDYECPFCGRHFQQTVPQIKQNYVDTGKAKVVFMDYPLNFHPNAQKAAEAARCAGDQKKFWEMHDKLFSNQQSLSVANYKAWAKELGLKTADFDKCLDSGKHAEAVQDDFTYGSSIGVRGTPGFFINGRQISGACPYTTFQQAIEAELDGKDWAAENCQFALI